MSEPLSATGCGGVTWGDSELMRAANPGPQAARG